APAGRVPRARPSTIAMATVARPGNRRPRRGLKRRARRQPAPKLLTMTAENCSTCAAKPATSGLLLIANARKIATNLGGLSVVYLEPAHRALPQKPGRPPRPRPVKVVAMRFTKMHGAGNDYVYVDCLQ